MKLYLTPEGSSYSHDKRPDTLRAEVEAGPSRQRKDFQDDTFILPLKFVLDPAEHKYLWAFYRQGAQNGSIPFTIDLLLDDEMQEYEAKFIGPPKLDSQEGLAYYYSVQLEVIKEFNPDQADDDTATIEAFETSIGV